MTEYSTTRLLRVDLVTHWIKQWAIIVVYTTSTRVFLQRSVPDTAIDKSNKQPFIFTSNKTQRFYSNNNMSIAG